MQWPCWIAVGFGVGRRARPSAVHADPAWRREDAGPAQSALARHAIEVYPQGSYRIGTTVRPLSEEEFDLDFVVELTALDEPPDPAELNPASHPSVD